MKFDLNRMVRVMGRLGNPQQSFPSIHVAGTNGKGSVCAMLSSVLRKAGLRVGLYTSPHLERLNERFQINGRMIPDRDLNRLSKMLIRKFPHLTQFEFLTALAFVWLAEMKVDVAIVETGLGGRLDATNVLHRVLVSVITNIDFDHTNWLGDTIEKIAYEKAGIIKSQVPLVTGAAGKALDVIQAESLKKNAPVISVRSNKGRWRTNLIGDHQNRNAAIAVAVLRSLADRGVFDISEKDIRSGLSQVYWPGRFEKIQTRTVLDGAHNPAGCRVLAKTLKLKKMSPVYMLFGALRDKNVDQMARELAPVVSRCVAVPVASDRSASAEELANLPGWRGKADFAGSISEGWRMIKSIKPKRTIVIAGSLYLVGEMRRKLK